ncbi:MAG TPA: cytochrome c oxidase assembly protein [Allosphingosinicella sp.]|nr:cytochrome c oxidase assembly protein [Allosphingosinicella sp.]
MTSVRKALTARPAMVAIVAASGLLWWLSRFHPAAMPPWAPWDFSFSWFFATAFPLLFYCRGLRRLPADRRPPAWRSACFFLGIAIVYAVLQTRLEYLAQHMFFLNRLQHVAMHHLGPFLIALAWPWEAILAGAPAALGRIALAPTSRGLLRMTRQPFIAAFLFVGLIALWLIPPVHFRAMIDPDMYLAMNWTMVGDGLLFWSLVLDPRDGKAAGISFGMRALLAVAVMFPQILIGALIAFSRHDLYHFYAWCGRLYPSIGPLDDQDYGGLIVWIPPAMMSVVALLLVLNALRLSEERRPAGQGDFMPAPWTGR